MEAMVLSYQAKFPNREGVIVAIDTATDECYRVVSADGGSWMRADELEPADTAPPAVDADDWMLTIEQAFWMLGHASIIEAWQNAPDDDLTAWSAFDDAVQSDEFKALFGTMSFDEAYDRYETMLEAPDPRGVLLLRLWQLYVAGALIANDREGMEGIDALKAYVEGKGLIGDG